MVVSDLRPSGLSEDLHHYVLGMYKVLEVPELLVLVVVRHSKGIVEVIEDLHAHDAVDVKEEDEEGHEANDDRHDFQKNGVDIDEFAPNLEFNVLEEAAVRDQS